MHDCLDRAGRRIDVGDLVRYHRPYDSHHGDTKLLAIFVGGGIVRVQLPNGMPETLLPDEVVVVVKGDM